MKSKSPRAPYNPAQTMSRPNSQGQAQYGGQWMPGNVGGWNGNMRANPNGYSQMSPWSQTQQRNPVFNQVPPIMRGQPVTPRQPIVNNPPRMGIMPVRPQPVAPGGPRMGIMPVRPAPTMPNEPRMSIMPVRPGQPQPGAPRMGIMPVQPRQPVLQRPPMMRGVPVRR